MSPPCQPGSSRPRTHTLRVEPPTYPTLRPSTSTISQSSGASRRTAHLPDQVIDRLHLQRDVWPGWSERRLDRGEGLIEVIQPEVAERRRWRFGFVERRHPQRLAGRRLMVRRSDAGRAAAEAAPRRRAQQRFHECLSSARLRWRGRRGQESSCTTRSSSAGAYPARRSACCSPEAAIAVLCVEKDPMPSDALSTHYLHPIGVARLRNWGLLEAVETSGCPRNHSLRGPSRRSGDARTVQPRRQRRDRVRALPPPRRVRPDPLGRGRRGRRPRCAIAPGSPRSPGMTTAP